MVLNVLTQNENPNICSTGGLRVKLNYYMSLFDYIRCQSYVSFCCDNVEGVPLETVLEVFGEYFFIYCRDHGYDKMLHTLGDTFHSFIQNLDSLHALLAMTYTEINAPSFRYIYTFSHRPANTKHLYNIHTMLDQRRRRWADVV